MTLEADRTTDMPPFSTALPVLPAFITLEDRKQYDVAGNVWTFPAGGSVKSSVTLNWMLLVNVVLAGTSIPVMSARALALIKLYASERLDAGRDSIKPLSATSYLFAMLAFARHLAAHPTWMPAGRSFDWSDMSADMFDVWLTLEYRKKRKGNFAIWVRSFYLWGANPDAGHPDFSADLASKLCAKRIKGSAKGELVESRDKKRGPFNREELELIYDACESGAGNDQDRAIAWTLLETAVRPKQLYLLNNQDLEYIEGVGEENDADGALTEVC
jgi:hypothetical protein